MAGSESRLAPRHRFRYIEVLALGKVGAAHLFLLIGPFAPGRREERMTQGISSELERIVHGIGSEIASELGLEVVDLALGRARRKWHIRLNIDRVGPTGVGIDDCQRVSHGVGTVLEQRDVIPGSYVLEVSSPGIDRPIRTADDVRRNTGRRVVVQTHEPLDGRSSFCGVLVGLEDGLLRLRPDQGDEVRVPFDSVATARQEIPF